MAQVYAPNPFAFVFTEIDAAERLRLQQYGWDNQVALDAPMNMEFYYDRIVAEGGTRKRPEDFAIGTFDRSFVQFLDNDATGVNLGGTNWQTFDKRGREISHSIGEGVVLRRAGSPRPR